MDMILNRSDNVVKVGDLVEMLLGISFGVKDLHAQLGMVGH